MKAASALREALWAMVSDVHLETPGVDYQAHARDYLARFERLHGLKRRPAPCMASDRSEFMHEKQPSSLSPRCWPPRCCRCHPPRRRRRCCASP